MIAFLDAIKALSQGRGVKGLDNSTNLIEPHLKCKTQTEIANIIGVTQGRIAQIINSFKNEKINNPPDSLQIYDIWNTGKLDQQYGQDYAGRIPGQIIENVLWYWTKVEG